MKGGQSLRPVQARVHAEARALFEVFIGAQRNYGVPLCHCWSVRLLCCFPAVINVTGGTGGPKPRYCHGASDRITLDCLPTPMPVGMNLPLRPPCDKILLLDVTELHNRIEMYSR